LSLSHLSIFNAVANAGSVTKAAEAISVSQPAVSKQIKLLESDVGVRLFERVGRGVRLTGPGITLAEYTRRIFTLVEEAEATLSDLQGLRKGRLSIGAGATVGAYLLPDTLVRFRQRFPGVTLNLEVGSSHLLRQRLREGSIEFALMEKSLPSPEFESLMYLADELVGIVPPKHPAARVKTITAAKFAKEPFVVREAESGTRSLVERAFAERGLRVHPAMALSSTEAVKRAVAAGLGVSIVSKMSLGAEVEAGHLAVVRLKDLLLRRPIYLVRQANRHESKAATAFLCLLKHVVRGKNK
ncbi:MAG TPA: LysR substrate-binding domain-containing protein, partial [Tepidisphaeraceae bacterium]|nr:LysR substrate-binding domain-containing protein [Tepidisphaeraceae bacterium]